MTTIAEAREATYKRFLDNWTGTASRQIVLGNEASDRLDGGSNAWVRFVVRNLDGGQATLGGAPNRKFVRQAAVVASIFTPAESAGVSGGLKAGDLLANEALNIFESVTFSDLKFQSGVIREQPETARWQQHLVEVAFFYEEQK